MQFTTETITPGMAKEWLDTANGANRRLDIRHVAFLAKTMESGDFASDNGDSIRFDVDGNLLDGQHRLAAIAKTGIAQQMVVARGIAREAFATIDVGKRRNVTDVVGIDLAAHGIVAPRGITSAAALMFGYECRFEYGNTTGNKTRGQSPPVSSIREICMRPGFVDTAVRATTIARRISAMIGPLTVALTVCELDSKQASDIYFHRLQTMEGMGAGAPEHSVTRTLDGWRKDGTPAHRSGYAQLFAVLRGYIASRDGKPLNLIRVPKTPEGFVYLRTK